MLHEPKNFLLISCPVFVPATPPIPVSLNDGGRVLPTFLIAWHTSSNGTILVIPANAMSALIIAFVTPIAFLNVHGYSTSPAIGSHTSPNTCRIANDAPWNTCSMEPPLKNIIAPAAIAAAEPVSAWQPPSAPENVAYFPNHMLVSH